MNAKCYIAMIGACSVLLPLAGCDFPPAAMEAATTDTRPVSAEESFDPTGMSPAELRAVIAESTMQSEQVASLLSSGVNYDLRLKEFRRHIATGYAAAVAVEQHPDTPLAEREGAAIDGLRLLYTGVQTDRKRFAQQLQDEVAARAESQPESQAAAVGEAMILELTVLSGEGEHETKLAALNEFSQRRPSSPAGPALFLQYGQTLEDSGDVETALECYRTAISKFPNSAQLNPVRRRIAAMEAAHHKRLAQQAARRAELASIKRQLARDDGYFVIYSHETGKTMYRFEYDVIKGADAAANHIMHLPEKWEWKMTARFPETTDGFSRASALREERVKKETVMQVPVFN